MKSSKYTSFKLLVVLIVAPLILTVGGCRKFIEVPSPKQSLVNSNVYTNTSSAAAVVTNIYMKMQSTDVRSFCTFQGIALGLAADELKNYNLSDPLLSRIYNNSLLSGNNEAPNFWSASFNFIYSANAAIEGISQSSAIPERNKNQLIGESKFLRAFLYFNLVNTYGAVPLVLTTDYRKNSGATRSDVQEVYRSIIQDLTDAKNLLSNDYLTPDNNVTVDRVRPNKFAAAALLARVYLYVGNWTASEKEASEVIEYTQQYSLCNDLNQVFKMNSSEAIWQLQPILPGLNTYDGITYILNSAPGTSQHPVAIAKGLITTFETGDKRKLNWVGVLQVANNEYFFPLKYKVGSTSAPLSEYCMVLRLAEQYLIRSEARANIGNITGALGDLNVIRNRAGLSPSSANEVGIVKAQLLNERRVELFTEWGHRWFDLKRTGKIDQVMRAESSVKGSIWSTHWQLFPIPNDDILKNGNLVQNEGYK